MLVTSSVNENVGPYGEDDMVFPLILHIFLLAMSTQKYLPPPDFRLDSFLTLQLSLLYCPCYVVLKGNVTNSIAFTLIGCRAEPQRRTHGLEQGGGWIIPVTTNSILGFLYQLPGCLINIFNGAYL